MEKNNSAVLIVCTILFTLSLLQPTKAQTTQTGEPFPLASPLTVLSPTNSTYKSSPQTLAITFKMIGKTSYTEIKYSIDGNPNSTLPANATLQPIEATRTYPNGTTVTVISMFSPYQITGQTKLPELAEGQHIIKVYSELKMSNYVVSDEEEISFTIDDETAPAILDFSIKNTTYTQTDLPLNFKLDQSVQWIAYCLDGQENITITGNSTLSSNAGSHQLKVYATDYAGNCGASETIYFEITETLPLPSATSISTIAIIIIGLGSITYFIRHKMKKHFEPGVF